MDWILELLVAHTLLIVFANVLVEQLGFPVPAYPAMIVAGSLVYRSHDSLLLLWLVCVLAALLADLAWYYVGKRVGASMIRTICLISLEPDACVASTRDNYRRWGPPSLIFAKFITGFATLATAMAGEARTRLRTFLFFDTLGALLWSGIAIGLGVVFNGALQDVLATLDSLGSWGVALLGALLVCFLGFKIWQRNSFRRLIAMERIDVDDLQQLMSQDSQLVIIDVRSDVDRRMRGVIPGAVYSSLEGPFPEVKGQDVVIYCACPNDASAAVFARRFRQTVRVRVRPLRGGVDAWIRAGGALSPIGSATDLAL